MNAPLLRMPVPARAPRGVRGIAIIFGLTLAGVLMALGVFAFFVTEARLDAAVDNSLLREQTRLLAAVPDMGPPSLPIIRQRINARTEGRSISNIGHRLLDPHGHVVAGTVRRLGGSGPVAGPVMFQEAWGKLRAGRAMTTLLPGGSRLDVVAESELLENMGRVVWPMFGTMLALACFGGLAASVALSNAIAARLEATRQTADAIVAGDLSRRVPVSGLDGMFADQANSFNRMLDRIEELMRRMRQMSADVAHDLRTPITRLQANLEIAVRTDRPPLERQAHVALALAECGGILALFNSLLRLSEIESGRQRAGFAQLDLAELVEEIAESTEPMLEDAGLTLVRGPVDRATVSADRDLLSQLIINLIENSARHAGAGARVMLAVTKLSDQRVRLRVADTGAGIAPADAERAIRRFVRLDRSRSTPGNGLGLALVDAIARLHGGTIALSDNRPGLIVDIILPGVSATLASASQRHLRTIADGGAAVSGLKD